MYAMSLIDKLEEGGVVVWDYIFENFAGQVATFENGEEKVIDGLSDAIEYTFLEEVIGDVGTGIVIEVYGMKDGSKVHFQSAFQTDMGMVTGYPVTAGAKMFVENKIKETGIMISKNAIPTLKKM